MPTEEKVREPNGIKLSREVSIVLHLLYVDNILIAYKANEKNIATIKWVLKKESSDMVK